jgi:hypothetical protein
MSAEFGDMIRRRANGTGFESLRSMMPRQAEQPLGDEFELKEARPRRRAKRASVFDADGAPAGGY